MNEYELYSEAADAA